MNGWRDLAESEKKKRVKCDECGKEATKICTHCGKGFCNPTCGIKHYQKMKFDFITAIKEKTK